MPKTLLAKLREALTVSPTVKPQGLTLANARRFKGTDVRSEQRAIRSCGMRRAVGTIGEGEIERFPSTVERGVGGVVAGPGPVRELRGHDVGHWLAFNASHHTRDDENSDDRICFHHVRRASEFDHLRSIASLWHRLSVCGRWKRSGVLAIHCERQLRRSWSGSHNDRAVIEQVRAGIGALTDDGSPQTLHRMMHRLP